jgi:predicted chitinase
MSYIGLNVPRDGSFPGLSVRALGATWIRIVATPEANLSGYLKDCKARGLRVLMVLAKESHPLDRTQLIAYYFLYKDLVDAWQVGNEPDLVSESSWTMTQAELVALGRLVRDVFPRPTHLVVGGLGSGQPDWLKGVDLSWADSLGLHLYLKDAPNPTDIEDLPDVPATIAAYRAVVPARLPFVMTEWGWWGAEEGRATEEVRDMVRWAAESPLIEAFFYFCAGDFMVAPFGLLDAEGRHKDRADAFTVASRLATPATWPRPGVEPTPEPAPAPGTPDPWQWWSPDEIAAAIRCPAGAIEEHWPRLVDQMSKCGIYELDVAVAMLATIAIETAHTFRPIHEFPDPARYPNSGGYPPHYGGGARFHGRGFIQLTHDYNYRAASIAVSKLWDTEIVPDPQLDLAAVPDRALDPDISAAVSALFFRDTRTVQGYGIVDAARAHDWTWVRKLVQGGTASLELLERYAELLLATADTDGEPETPPLPVPTPTPTPQPVPPVEPGPAVPPAEELAALRIALADVCDRVGDLLQGEVNELRRIREQFLGPRG